MLRRQTHCHIDNGDSAPHQTHPILQTNHGFQSSPSCSSLGDGSCEALCDLNSRKGLTPSMMKKIRWIEWNLAELIPLFDECPNFFHHFTMNVIAWNCRVALNPTFQGHIHDLVQNHDPAIMIVMETKLVAGGQRRLLTVYRLMELYIQKLLGMPKGSGYFGTLTR